MAIFVFCFLGSCIAGTALAALGLASKRPNFDLLGTLIGPAIAGAVTLFLMPHGAREYFVLVCCLFFGWFGSLIGLAIFTDSMLPPQAGRRTAHGANRLK